MREQLEIGTEVSSKVEVTVEAEEEAFIGDNNSSVIMKFIGATYNAILAKNSVMLKPSVGLKTRTLTRKLPLWLKRKMLAIYSWHIAKLEKV